MTSTRNKNTQGNFDQEFNSNKQLFHTVVSKSRIYKESYLPGEGLLMGTYPLNIMANNQVDIESSIFGIGSTNLIQPKSNIIKLHDLRRLDSLNVCQKTPVVMPEPLVVRDTYTY
jgi:hypothetical protein